jgi:Fe-S cluster assembly ATP-binding protein
MEYRRSLLEVRDLHVEVEGKEVIRGLDLVLHRGEKLALMGPNGSGKSSLSMALMGHPGYKIKRGAIVLDGNDITGLSPDRRAKVGLFLAMQNPVVVQGLSVTNFLRAILKAKRGEEVPIREFREMLVKAMGLLEMERSFAARYVNDGFSGGEKKKLELLQMTLLNPKVAVVDEIDSGLDVDALKIVAEGINRVASEESAFLLITHYRRILDYIRPDGVAVLMDGRIVASGGPELINQIDRQGYDWLAVKTA